MLTLTGLDPNNPIPTVAREFRPAQGASLGTPQQRAILLVGNKTSAGTASTNVLSPSPIQNQGDMDVQVGGRSELRWMYYALGLVRPAAAVFFIAVPEAGGATAASNTWTFATNASANCNMVIQWGGQTIYASVLAGDTPPTQAQAAVAAIAANPNVPFTAGVSTSVLTLTCANLGPRGSYVLDGIQISYDTANATTITPGSVSAGTGPDDVTDTIAALTTAPCDVYYHACAMTAITTVTATDNGVGEYIAYIQSQVSPSGGLEMVANFGLVCTQAQATSVATSGAANTVWARFWHPSKKSPWTPAMLAAHHAAILHVQETLDPAANINGYHNTDATPYDVPAPYLASDKLTVIEQKADLNNGVSCLAFDQVGNPFLVRHVTSYSWVNTSATKDYRAREGHITSVLAYFWRAFLAVYIAQKQPKTVSQDPPVGQAPLPGVQYPNTVRSLLSTQMAFYAGKPFATGPILDPDVLVAMQASINVDAGPAGVGVTFSLAPVRHNITDLFQINQTGPAY